METVAARPSYEFVPAGLYSVSHMGLAIYIRYETNPNHIKLIEQSARHTVIECPDRTLYVVGDRHFAEPFPVDFSYDEVVVPSPFWPRTGSALGISNYMMNYTQYLNREENSPKMRRTGRQPEHTQTIFADSGGFQIQNELFDYIAPEGLINWYNENCDVGAVLDFPPAGLYWPGLVELMGEAQARSTEILLAKRRPDLELMNVFHGETFSDVQRFREIVEHADINRVAIGGAYHSSILKSIVNATRIMLDGRQYSHYHMLGVSNIKQVYPIMRMASQGIAPYITSDSSTALNEALNKGYYVWPSVNSPPRYYKIGDKTNQPNSGKVLPCSCPVCGALKYSDIFSVFSGNTLSFLMMLHNIYAYTSLTKAMHEIISEASLKDLKGLLRHQLATRANGRDEVLGALDYVDEVARNGVDSGQDKIAYFLGGVSGGDDHMPVRSLFNQNATRDYDVEDEEAVELVPADDPRRVRMERILGNYVRHADQVGKDSVRVKQKERIRKAKGHTKASAGAIRIPGKKRIMLGKRRRKVKA